MIFQPPDDYTDLRDIGPQSQGNAEEQEQEYLSKEAQQRVEQRKHTLKRLFFILLGAGLVAGAILSIGILVLLDRLDVMFEAEPDIPQEQLSPSRPQEIRYDVN